MGTEREGQGMSDFATWLREWNDKSAMEGSGQHDIVLLAAQQHEALVRLRQRRPDLFYGVSALRAAEEFRERYG